jgi:colanic acid/amylovoran biosynthesis glycosyltransferase
MNSMETWEPIAVGLRSVKSSLTTGEDHIVPEKGLGAMILRKTLRFFGWHPPLRRLIQDVDPALIHVHFLSDARGLDILAKRLRIPLVVTSHGHDGTVSAQGKGLLSSLYRSELRRVIRNSSKVIAVSRYLSKQLELRFGNKIDSIVLYIGTPIHEEAARDRDIDVLFVGRLVERKGARVFIDVVASLVGARPGTRAVVVGDGPERDYMESQNIELRLNIQFLGVQSPSEVARWMSRSRVLLVPSFESRPGAIEAFGMVCLEAAVSSTPVVGFTHGGVVEAVEHGASGLLVPEGDIEGLSRATGSVLDNSAEWDRLSSLARERAVREFDIRQCTRRLECLYEEVLGTHGGPLLHSNVKASKCKIPRSIE